MNNNIALVDMDGTIADYDGAMKKSLEAIRDSKNEPPLEIGYDCKQEPFIYERMKLIKSDGEWWESLPRLKLGFDVVNILEAHNFYMSILTQGPKDNSVAWSHKVRWCIKNVPYMDITITRNKGLAYGKILVDDYPEYVMQWLEHRPRGLVIMPAQRWNVNFTHPQVIRYDGTNLKYVEHSIEVVKNRKAGEDWK